MQILSRIMKTILERDSINRTNLAQEANVNYVRLVNHLSWLEKKHFVEYVVEKGKIIIRLTQQGREFAIAITTFL